jgi:hypothetical protein
VTRERAAELALLLDVDLHSRGVCPACLSLVALALEDGDERRVAGRITSVAPDLWAEGLGEAVRAALERAGVGNIPAVAEALTELEQASFRSRIFRAIVRRLAVELAEDSRRAFLASLN